MVRAGQERNGSATWVSRKEDSAGDPFSGVGERRLAILSQSVRRKSFNAPGFLESVLSTGFGLRRQTISNPYRESGWLHSAINIFAAAVRSAPLQFFDQDPKATPGAKPLGEDHPLVRLFKRPNPQMTAGFFFSAGVQHRMISGEDFWLLRDRNRHVVKPVGRTPEGRDIIPLPAIIDATPGRHVQHKTSTTGFVERWSFPMANGDRLQVEPGSVVHLRDYDATDALRGYGRTQVLLRALQQEFTAEQYTEGLLANSGDPGGLIRIKQTLDPEIAEEAQNEADEEFSNPSNRGRWKVIEGEDVEIVPNKLGPKDMEFEQLFKRVRELVASLIGVPLPVMGVLEKATWSNFAQAARLFWEGGNGVISYLSTVEDAIENDLVPRIREFQAVRIYPRFDLSEIPALNADENERREMAAKLVKMVPGMTWDYAAQVVGLDLQPAPYGDVAFVSSTMVTVDAAMKAVVEADDEDAQDEPDDDEEDEEDPPADDEQKSALGGLTLRDVGAEPAADRLRELWRKVFTEVVADGESQLRRKATSFLRSYERAQLALWKAFAEHGVDALLDQEPDLGELLDERSALLQTKADAPDEASLALLLLQKAKWEDRLRETLSEGIARVFEEAGKDIAADLGVSFIGMQDPEITAFLLEQEIKVAEGVTSTLAKQVRAILLKHIDEAPSITDLQELIREILPELEGSLRKAFKNKDARALTIARTETAHAANGARFISMKRAGVKRHQWVSSEDDAVRDSHEELHGEIRIVGQEFKPGLRYPLDANAPAEEVINCRCLTVEVFEEEEE